MNKVFGILLGCLVVLASVGTDGAWAGNWNTTKKGVGKNGVYKDKDWSHPFFDYAGFPDYSEEKWNTRWLEEGETRFLRFRLFNGQSGTRPIDKNPRSGAPYWERAEVKAGSNHNTVYWLDKTKIYQIKFKVRFVSGFTGDRETFLQIHNYRKGCKSSSKPPVMLKFNNGLLEPAYMREDGSGHNKIFLKSPTHISSFYSKWVEFTLEYGPSSKQGLAAITLSMDGKIMVRQDKVWQSSCGQPHVKFGIYRGGNEYVPNPTSIIDFDYIKITKGDKISFSRSNTDDDKVPSAQAATDPYQSYSDKQICTMVGALNGLAEQKLWIKEAKRRGLSKCK